VTYPHPAPDDGSITTLKGVQSVSRVVAALEAEAIATPELAVFYRRMAANLRLKFLTNAD